MKKVLIILGLLAVLITGCSEKTEAKKEDKKRTEYIENKSENKYFIEIDTTDYIEKVNNKEKFVIFIGSSQCGACKTFKPIITKFANEQKVTVYFIDLIKTSDEDRNKIYNVQTIDYLPTLLIFEKGKVVFNEYGVKYNNFLLDLKAEYKLGE